MMKKIRVLFLINNLGGGGAERVLINLVNNMDLSRFEVTVQTFFKAGINKDLLSKRIRFIEGSRREFHGVSRLVKITPKRLLSKNISQQDYDVAIAYLHGVTTKVLWNYSGKKIAWLHNDMNYANLEMFFFKRQIIKCFDSYDRIVGVSDTVCKSFSDLYGLDNKLVTKYNTNDTRKIIELSNSENYQHFSWNDYPGLKLISLGRLVEQKGYDRLIRICKELYNNGFDFRVLILGQGEQESLLKKLISDNNMTNKIELGGFKSNPYPYLKQADLFVCSSRYEGLSTVMSETLIIGTPIITTDVSGAREVLLDSEYGMIVENSTDALYEGLKKLLSKPRLIEYYKNQALIRAPFFDVETTVSAVEDLIEEVVNEP